MDDKEEVLAQIRTLCSEVSENTYETAIQKGCELADRLFESGVKQETAYQALLCYHNSLEDCLSRDLAADILDFVSGWCSPQKRIWKD